jgi:hypothetical protein
MLSTMHSACRDVSGTSRRVHALTVAVEIV